MPSYGTPYGREFDRYYDLYRRRRTPAFPLVLANGASRNAARANAAVKRQYPKHRTWLISKGKLRLDGKPKRSKLKPCWLMERYKVNEVNSDAFTMCLKDKDKRSFYPDPVDGSPRDNPAFRLEQVYYQRHASKIMTPAFMKYVLKEYGYDLKI